MQHYLSINSHTRRLAYGGLVGLCFAALVIGCVPRSESEKPTQTNDDPAVGSNAAQEIMAEQIPLITAANQISQLDPKRIGLGGIRLKVKSGVVEVWWKGEVPDKVRAEAERQQRENQVQIEFHSSKYNETELDEAAQSVLARRAEYSGLSYVGPQVDGSGLVVGLTNLEGSDTLSFPIESKVVQAEVMVPTTRADDSPPWWAGGVTMAVGGPGACSTGFAVHRTFLGIEYSRGILTANHCFFGGGVTFTDGTGQAIGVAEPRPTGTSLVTDSLYIPTTSGARTFDGGVGVGEFSKPVVALTRVIPGMSVCTSGAAAGVHCGITITSINNNSVFAFPSGAFVQGVAFGTQDSGSVATAPGDSGGPVFTLDSDPSRVRAAGMIVGGFTPTACLIPGQTGCLSSVAFVDISYVLISHNASLLTP
jgi:hypothetical protein